PSPAVLTAHCARWGRGPPAPLQPGAARQEGSDGAKGGLGPAVIQYSRRCGARPSQSLCLLGRPKDYFINAYLARQPRIVFAYPGIVGCSRMNGCILLRETYGEALRSPMLDGDRHSRHLSANGPRVFASPGHLIGGQGVYPWANSRPEPRWRDLVLHCSAAALGSFPRAA